MKILDFNAAALLFEKVKSLKQSHNSWRCIYLNLSDKRMRYNQGLRINFILKALNELLADEEGYIYVCEDGDLFILFQGALKPIMATLSNHFDDLKPSNMEQNDLFAVFDLGTHWQAFYHLSKAKYLAIADDLPLHFNYQAHALATVNKH